MKEQVGEGKSELVNTYIPYFTCSIPKLLREGGKNKVLQLEL